MKRRVEVPWTTPKIEEINLEGFFLGQLVCPKENHFPGWLLGQIVNFQRIDWSPGAVLKVKDIITGKVHHELVNGIDFLARANHTKGVPLGICMLTKKEHILCSMIHYSHRSKVFRVMAIGTGEEIKIDSISSLYKLVRVKTNFDKFN